MEPTVIDRIALHTELNEMFPDIIHVDHINGTILISDISTIDEQDAFDNYDPTYYDTNGVHPDLFQLVVNAGWFIDYDDLTGDYLISRLC